jgi:hypothetical protein
VTIIHKVSDALVGFLIDFIRFSYRYSQVFCFILGPGAQLVIEAGQHSGLRSSSFCSSFVQQHVVWCISKKERGPTESREREKSSLAKAK